MSLPSPCQALRFLANALGATAWWDQQSHPADPARHSSFRDRLDYAAQTDQLSALPALRDQTVRALWALDPSGLLPGFGQHLWRYYARLLQEGLGGTAPNSSIAGWLVEDAAIVFAAFDQDVREKTSIPFFHREPLWFVPAAEGETHSALGRFFALVERQYGLTRWTLYADDGEHESLYTCVREWSAQGRRPRIGHLAREAIVAKLAEATGLPKDTIIGCLLLARAADCLFQSARDTLRAAGGDDAILLQLHDRAKAFQQRRIQILQSPFIAPLAVRPAYSAATDQALRELLALIALERPKALGDLERAQSLRAQLDQDPAFAGPWRALRSLLDARMALLQADSDQALAHYKATFESARYALGAEFFATFLDEYLTLLAVSDPRIGDFEQAWCYGAVVVGLWELGPSNDEIRQQQHYRRDRINALVSPASFFPEAQPKQVERLLARGLPRNIIYTDNLTHAAQQGAKRYLKITPGGTSSSALMYAIVDNASAETIRERLQRGQPGDGADYVDASGGSALLCALQRLYRFGGTQDSDARSIALLLLEQHIPKALNAVTRAHGLSPLQQAVHHFDQAMIAALLAAGADPAQKVGAHRTPLVFYTLSAFHWHRSIPATADELIEASLLAAGRLPGLLGGSRTEQQRTLQSLRKNVRHRNLLEATLRVANDSREAVTESDVVSILEQLHGAGAPFNVGAGRERMTPLMFACELNLAAVVRMMLARGADPHARSISGHTAHDYAQQYIEDLAVQNLLRPETH